METQGSSVTVFPTFEVLKCLASFGVGLTEWLNAVPANRGAPDPLDGLTEPPPVAFAGLILLGICLGVLSVCVPVSNSDSGHGGSAEKFPRRALPPLIQWRSLPRAVPKTMGNSAFDVGGSLRTRIRLFPLRAFSGGWALCHWWQDPPRFWLLSRAILTFPALT